MSINHDKLLNELSGILGELEITDGQLYPVNFDLRTSENFDSMSLTMFVCAIEDHYKISLTLSELAESGTRMANVISLILSKLALVRVEAST